MNIFRFVPGYEQYIYEAGKEPLFLLLLSFLIAFFLTRLYTRLGRVRGWGSGNVGGVHLHHIVPGIILALVAGLLLAATSGAQSTSRGLIAIVFGAGAALILDEFALVLHLEDVYWSERGRLSVESRDSRRPRHRTHARRHLTVRIIRRWRRHPADHDPPLHRVQCRLRGCDAAQGEVHPRHGRDLHRALRLDRHAPAREAVLTLGRLVLQPQPWTPEQASEAGAQARARDETVRERALRATRALARRPHRRKLRRDRSEQRCGLEPAGSERRHTRQRQ